MVTSSETVLITGANRGIGLELVRHYAAEGWRVHACCRNPENADELRDSLMGHDGLVHPLDVTDHQSIHDLVDALEGEAIDILINNAGMYGGDHQGFGDMDYDAWARTFETNTFAPYRVIEALLDNVAAGRRKTIANISSRMGSITNYVRGGGYIYRTSKTALNMVSLNLANDLRDHGFIVTAFHPGWVQTDMGGAAADISAEHSARSLRDTINTLTPDQSGLLLNYDGAVIEW